MLDGRINDLNDLGAILEGWDEDFYTIREVERVYTGYCLNDDAEMIVLDKVENKALLLTWVECQEYGPDFSTLDITEVQPVTRIVTTWETVKRNKVEWD